MAKVFVNPAEYIFQEKIHYGYVIASELPDFNQLRHFTFPEHIQRVYNTEELQLLTKKYL